MIEILVMSETDRLADSLRASYSHPDSEAVTNAQPGPDVAAALASPSERPSAVCGQPERLRSRRLSD